MARPGRFLGATRVDGAERQLIDPGSYDNFAGSRWVGRRGDLAREARLTPIQTEMGESIGAGGAGAGAQIA
eukprot:6455682-Pyramimonas_sp.AAC.1